MMNKDIFVKLLQERRYKSVKDVLDVMNAVDIASLLGEFDDKELALAFRLIPKEKAADVFANMESSLQSVLVEALSEKELKEILNDLYMDDTVDLLEELPANLVTRILDASGPKERETINKLLNYPEDSAGSIMTTEYVDLKPYLTVGQALAHIKKTGIHKETIYTCYVIQQRKLLGIVSAKDLMTTDDNVLIEDIMETEIISVSTLTDKEDVAHQLRKYDLLALPVLDTDGLLVGIVTFDDAMDVMVEEATEDITKMAAVSPSEKTYFEVSAWEHAKRRIPWLLVLMFSSIITGTIITRYEDAFAAIPLLVSFIPMLMDTGGNSGSQSSVTVIRALSLDELRFKDILSVIWKEIRTAALCGLVLSVLCFGKVMLVDRLLMGNASVTVWVDVTVCLTLGVTVLVAKVVGCSLPLIAKRLGFDPAVMASPFITTIVDAMSLLLYFFFAKLLLGVSFYCPVRSEGAILLSAM